MPPMISIAEQIRMAREAAGMTPGQLSEACGWAHHSMLSRLESGVHEAKVETLQRIADATGWVFTIAPSRGGGPALPLG